MKILMISPYIPWPLRGGTAVRIFNILKELSGKKYEIILLAGSDELELNSNSPLNKICKEVHLFKLAPGNSLIFKLKSIFSFKPYPFLRFETDSLQKKIHQLLTSQNFDLIWVNLSVLADALPVNLIRNTPVLLDHPECEELVYKDYIKERSLALKLFSVINLIKLKILHKKILIKADFIFCVSKEEADFTRNQIQNKIKVYVVPNGVDEKVFHPDEVFENKPDRIIFCSSMGVRRNIDAVVWFVKSIFPQVKKEIPDAEFWIVGSNPTQEILQLNSINGIRVVGTVNNIEDYYKMGKVFVAPYHFGAGTKLKVLEAMASGIPVVSTSIGCRGIEVIDKKHLLIADTEEDFANCIIDLLSKPALAKKLSGESLSLIKEKYCWDNIVNDLEPKILEVIKNTLSSYNYQALK